MTNKNDVQYKSNENPQNEEGKIPSNTRNDKIMEKKTLGKIRIKSQEFSFSANRN